MKVLLLCDDYWHPGKVVTDGVKFLSEKDYIFDIISDAADFSADVLSNYDVVMLCKCDQKSQAEDIPWLTSDIQAAFQNYVENGGGLLTVHSGTVPGTETDMISSLIGCRFTHHPNSCPVMVAPVMPHPVTEGVDFFNEIDEHYRIEILDSDAKVILASYSAAQGDENLYPEDPYHNTPAWLGAAGLVRTQGKGRVCVLTPGHTPDVWANKQFQKLIINALNWCSGK